MKDSFFINGKSLNYSNTSGYDSAVAVALEASRLSEKYGKDSFDAADLQKILCIGRDNARALMNERAFPARQIGNRKIVTALALAEWMTGKFM